MPENPTEMKLKLFSPVSCVGLCLLLPCVTEFWHMDSFMISYKFRYCERKTCSLIGSFISCSSPVNSSKHCLKSCPKLLS